MIIVFMINMLGLSASKFTPSQDLFLLENLFIWCTVTAVHRKTWTKNQLCQQICLIMYVCMYRGCHLWNCPRDRAFQLGLGEGPINKLGPMTKPLGTIDTASCTLIRTHACIHFLSQLYSRQLRVIMGPVCHCTSYIRIQDTFSCLD